MCNPLTSLNLSHVSQRFRLSPTRVRAHTGEGVIRHRWDRWDSRDSDAQTHLVAFGPGPSPCHPAAGDADRDSNRFADFFGDGF